jgi:purine-binding chemotaxis protein CheW
MLQMARGKKTTTTAGDPTVETDTWEDALRAATGDSATTAADPLEAFFVSTDEAEANQDIAAGDSMSGTGRSLSVAELLAFWVGDEEHGVDIVQIQEIIKVPTITVVPRALACVLGIISLRGTVVPVADLRAILGMESTAVTRATRILVLRGDGEPVGLLVDRVSSVVRFDREAIEPVPRTMQREASDLLQGVGRDGDRMLIILELPAVIAAMEQAG